VTVDDDPARSAQLIASGQLPLKAQERLADLASRQVFTSDLSVAEFEVIRSVGFEPVGQVMGSCVYQIGYAGYGSCGWVGGGFSPGGWSTTAGLRLGTAFGGGFEPLVHALRDVRHRAMERARAEAAALGGDGVVAVRLTMSRFPGTTNAVEFQAIGTAVRAAGPHRPRRPFLSDLSGQDFAKALSAGYVPVDLVLGIAVEIRHDDWATRSSASALNVQNTEVPGYTELVTAARAEARRAIEADLARVGGQVAVVSDLQLRIHEQGCLVYQGGTDHIAEATIVGTALAAIPGAPRKAAKQLAVLPVATRTRRRRPEAVISI
jgi:uncharacterized protein YbjQ (UPF0145 family)